MIERIRWILDITTLATKNRSIRSMLKSKHEGEGAVKDSKNKVVNQHHRKI